MGAGHLDLRLEAGAVYERKLTWRAKATPPAVGELIPLAGYTGRLQIRARPEAEDILVELTSDPDDGITLTSPGVIELRIGADVTAGLGVGLIGVYALELTPDGDATQTVRVVEGSVIVSPEVTRVSA